MNVSEINNAYSNIQTLIGERKLSVAFLELKKLSNLLDDEKINFEIEKQESIYKAMLHYMFEGMKDPEQKKVYHTIVQALYEISDNLKLKLLQPVSQNYYFDRLRIDFPRVNQLGILIKEHKEIVSSISLLDLLTEGEEKKAKLKELNIKRERIGILLFNQFVIANASDSQVKIELKDFIESPEVALREKCLLATALTLNLSFIFNEENIKLLISLCFSEENLLKNRALVGLILILQKYDERLKYYASVNHYLQALNESGKVNHNIKTIIIQLIRSRDTERISRRMTEEILPQMIKFSKLAGKKLSPDDLIGGSDFMDKNPEWKKEIESTGLDKKIKEYSDMQMEGEDVFHSTFSSLKSYPFFGELSNWFLPFDKNYSEINSLFPETANKTILQMAITESAQMCNSDKYSFCLTLMNTPMAQREILLQSMGAQSEEIKQLMQANKSVNPRQDEDIITNQYIQDLYRFYNLNRHRADFDNLLKKDIDYLHKDTIIQFLASNDDILEIANFCFDKDFFVPAQKIYQLLIDRNEQSATIYQKLGYCYQMANKHQEALEAYLKVELLDPSNSWTLRHIGQIYRTLEQPDIALSYFERAAIETPNNMSIELNIGHCYLEMGEYDKALNAYFKVELMDAKHHRAFRPIAWTSFLLNKCDIAEKYYKKILEANPQMHDFLNAGHVQLVKGNLKEAIAFYEKAKQSSSNEQIMRSILDDKKILVEKGVDDELFYYIEDKLNYNNC